MSDRSTYPEGLEPTPRTDHASLSVRERLTLGMNLLAVDDSYLPLSVNQAVGVLMEALGEPEILVLQEGRVVKGWLQ